MEHPPGQAAGSGEGVHDLGYARLDTDRHRRTGDPEVVLGTGKTPEQVVEILRTLAAAHPDRAVLATRLSPTSVEAVQEQLPEAEVDAVARAVTLGPRPAPRGTVCIVTAGTSDLPVATEAALTARAFGAAVRVVSDVGVAGLHRLLAVRTTLDEADCLVVVAGMEGALPSVVGGLVGVPIVAVPTSVGYGASFGGVAALLAMLNSCAPGVSVVNIDNGFGAGVFAARVARSARTAASPGEAAGPSEAAEKGEAAEAGTVSPPAGSQDNQVVGGSTGAGDGGKAGREEASAGRTGWLDASAGVSGDMLLGAIVDAGVPVEVLRTAVEAVAPGAVQLRTEEVRRGGLRALRVHVEMDGQPADHAPPQTSPDHLVHRTWTDVRELLTAAAIDEAVRSRALDTFARLAGAEAAVHGVDPEQVQFHEVGALDAIADVVGVCAGLHELGLDRLVCSPIAVGGGTVGTAHGRLPVPVPAVAALLSDVPTHGGPVDAELATPTGAALLTASVSGWGLQPAMAVQAVGVGAGSRDHAGHPNVVRLLVGSAAPLHPQPDAGRPLLLQTNVDDLDPRLWPGVLTKLLEIGASDAWLTPILMKKGRPAHTLSVLVRPDVRAAAEQVVFAETTTIGLRVQEIDKVALDRSELVVQVHGHPVRVKAARRDGEVVNLQPEYEDVLAVARATDLPVRRVLVDAAGAARAAGRGAEEND